MAVIFYAQKSKPENIAEIRKNGKYSQSIKFLYIRVSSGKICLGQYPPRAEKL